MGCGSMSSTKPCKVKCKDNCQYRRDVVNSVDGGSNNSAPNSLVETSEELPPSCDNLLESGAADDLAQGADPFLFAEHDNDSDILDSSDWEYENKHVTTTHFDNRNK